MSFNDAELRIGGCYYIGIQEIRAPYSMVLQVIRADILKFVVFVPSLAKARKMQQMRKMSASIVCWTID